MLLVHNKCTVRVLYTLSHLYDVPRLPTTCLPLLEHDPDTCIISRPKGDDEEEGDAHSQC